MIRAEYAAIQSFSSYTIFPSELSFRLHNPLFFKITRALLMLANEHIQKLDMNVFVNKCLQNRLIMGKIA